MLKHEADKPVLLAERRVAERYGVNWRTLWRWDERPELEFPPVIKIGTRRFRELAALEEWDRRKRAQGGGALKGCCTSEGPIPEVQNLRSDVRIFGRGGM